MGDKATELSPYPDSLVLYKGRPARVRRVGKQIEIELPGNEHVNVRAKDIQVLHPGPLTGLGELQPCGGDVQTAWELLAGSPTNLAELAELAYGQYTPVTAWAAWQLVADGLYFRGTPAEVTVRTHDEVARTQLARQERAAEEQAWADFLARARSRQVVNTDRRYVRDIEDLALGRTDRSRVLHDLNLPETPEGAHAALLEMGCWDASVDPYPHRFGLATTPTLLDVPPLPDEPRLDLTHLPAFAVDDEGSQDPDDALSMEGNRLWVHIADVAALIAPGSDLDVEARSRASTLYLPEGAVPMLPAAAVRLLGLGLEPVSPALSFGLDMDADAGVYGLHVAPSWVRVTRLSYEQAEARLAEEPFRSLWELAQSLAARRRAQGAVHIDLPEVKIRVDAGRVSIRPLAPLRSREMVAEAMLLTGASVARKGSEEGLPLPFTSQDPPGSDERPSDLAGMFALRQTLRPGQQSTIAGPHAGLGLEEYVQATSPLRRYPDLVVHQQLRARLRAQGELDTQAILERLGETSAIAAGLRQAERLARRHWTLVYLQQNPGWEGEGVVVDKRDRRATVLVPALDLDTVVHLRRDVPLNGRVALGNAEVDLARLEVRFQSTA